MAITGTGWELLVKRLGLHQSHGTSRTYATYQAFRDGQPVEALHGFLCECPGPGDNSTPGNGLRVEEGRYPLFTQFGTRYRTIGYSQDEDTPAVLPMPGILLKDTGHRTAILIHPGHPPHLFLSSVGCLNLTHRLEPSDLMNFWESRDRVIAMIEDLKDFDPDAFHGGHSKRIDKAAVVIEGEPMNVLRSSPPPLVAAGPEDPQPFAMA